MPRGRPRIHPPGTTPTEIARLSRIRRREAGSAAATVEISADTLEILDRVRRAGETRQAVVARLVRQAAGD